MRMPQSVSMYARTMLSFVSRKAFIPSTVTASSGLVRCRPPRIRSSVDLPAPLAPMRRQLCGGLGWVGLGLWDGD